MDPMAIRIVIAGEEVRVGDLIRVEKRSWRERLLTWPWRPWIAERAHLAELWKAMDKRGTQEFNISEVFTRHDH